MRPADIRVEFDEVAWESPSLGIRFKTVCRNGLQLRLVEFSLGFVEQDWCEKKHIGYVLAGELAIELPEGVTHIREGQGIVLSGHGSRHKAAAITETAVLFLVEELQ